MLLVGQCSCEIIGADLGSIFVVDSQTLGSAASLLRGGLVACGALVASALCLMLKPAAEGKVDVFLTTDLAEGGDARAILEAVGRAGLGLHLISQQPA